MILRGMSASSHSRINEYCINESVDREVREMYQ